MNTVNQIKMIFTNIFYTSLYPQICNRHTVSGLLQMLFSLKCFVVVSKLQLLAKSTFTLFNYTIYSMIFHEIVQTLHNCLNLLFIIFSLLSSGYCPRYQKLIQIMSDISGHIYQNTSRIV